jgi:hypothetical protein
MEDFTILTVGAASKNGSVVHPFSQNAKPIFIIPKRKVKKNSKIAEKGGPTTV